MNFGSNEITFIFFSSLIIFFYALCLTMLILILYNLNLFTVLYDPAPYTRMAVYTDTL